MIRASMSLRGWSVTLGCWLVAFPAGVAALSACGGSGTYAGGNGGGASTHSTSGVLTEDGGLTLATGGSTSVSKGSASASAHSTGTVIPGITAPDGGACIAADPVVTVTTPAGSYTTCTGAIAETRFLNALCTCGDLTERGNLVTSGINSTDTTGNDVGGGSVGVNGDFFLAGNATIGGALTLAGTTSTRLFASELDIGENFWAEPAIVENGTTQIRGNAYFASTYVNNGHFTVWGDVYSGSSVQVNPANQGTFHGSIIKQSVTVAAPCACKSTDLLDIGALVDEAKASNDDTLAGVDPKALANVQLSASLTLTCGKYFLTSIAGGGSVHLDVKGPVSLFVDDSISLVGNITISLDPLASIDIFIRNNITIAGNSSFGNTDRPAATRLYVGKGDITLAGNGNFVGNVYAPNSAVTLPGNFTVYGSIFAKDFTNPGNTSIVYDRAIQHAGRNCTQSAPPAGTCSQCGTCTGGTACVGGSCGACTKDSDCCSPLTCQSGKCEEYVPPAPR